MLGDDVNFEKSQSGETSFTDHYQAQYPNQNASYDRVQHYPVRDDPEIIQKTRFIIEESEKAYLNLLEVEDTLKSISTLDSTSIDPHDQRFSVFAEAALYLVGKDSTNQRHLEMSTLKKFKVGLGEEAFKDEDG